MAKTRKIVDTNKAMSDEERALIYLLGEPELKRSGIEGIINGINSHATNLGLRINISREGEISYLNGSGGKEDYNDLSATFRREFERRFATTKQELLETERMQEEIKMGTMILDMINHEGANHAQMVFDATRYSHAKSTPESSEYDITRAGRDHARILGTIIGLASLGLSEESMRSGSRIFNLEKLVQEQLAPVSEIMKELKVGMVLVEDYAPNSRPLILYHRSLIGVTLGTLLGNMLNHAPEGMNARIKVSNAPIKDSVNDGYDGKITLNLENYVGPGRKIHGFKSGAGLTFVKYITQKTGGVVEDYLTQSRIGEREGKKMGYQNATDENPENHPLFGIEVGFNVKYPSEKDKHLF